MSHEKVSKTSTTYLSGMGVQTLQNGVRKIPCSFGEWVKAQVILYIQVILFIATVDFPHSFNVKNSIFCLFTCGCPRCVLWYLGQKNLCKVILTNKFLL